MVSLTKTTSYHPLLLVTQFLQWIIILLLQVLIINDIIVEWFDLNGFTVVLVVSVKKTSSAILVVAGSGPSTSPEASPNFAHFFRAATGLGTRFLSIRKTRVTYS